MDQRASRRTTLATLGASLLLAGRASAQDSASALDQRLGRLGFIRSMAPPSILQQVLDVQRMAAVTKPALEQSTAPQVRDFRAYLDGIVARERDPMKRLQRLNSWVNRHVRQTSDAKLYLKGDLWAPPLNTLLVGGDCEDLALVKIWALKRLGFEPGHLYLAGGVSRQLSTPGFHAVIAVDMPPDRAAILDSLSEPVHATAADARFSPLYLLNAYGFWRMQTVTDADRPYWDEIARAVHPPPVRL